MMTCCKCKETLDESKFLSYQVRKGRKTSYCKDCIYIYLSDRWVAVKKRAVEHKGEVCLDCGRRFPYPVYEFHHRNPEEKDHNWQSLRKKPWARILEELDKCDLLCANCHRMRHHNEYLAKLSKT